VARLPAGPKQSPAQCAPRVVTNSDKYGAPGVYPLAVNKHYYYYYYYKLTTRLHLWPNVKKVWSYTSTRISGLAFGRIAFLVQYTYHQCHHVINHESADQVPNFGVKKCTENCAQVLWSR